jgi:3'5'-cyclic nucleotide phosphodiesterase
MSFSESKYPDQIAERNLINQLGYSYLNGSQTTRKGFYLEFVILTLFVFTSDLVYYIQHKEISILIIGVVLCFMVWCALLLFFVLEHNYRYNNTLVFPSVYLFAGLCFVFQDPDVLQVLLELDNEVFYFPSLLSLILLSVVVGRRFGLSLGIEYANLVLGILSFCLCLKRDEILGRNIYLFITLIFILIDSIRSKILFKKKTVEVKYEEVPNEKEYDMDFEEITTRLQSTADMLKDIQTSSSMAGVIKKSILNITTVSLCLQKKSNIYAVKVNSVTRNMDEQDMMFIKESIFDTQFKNNEPSINNSIKIQNEYSYGVAELMGILKNITKDWNFNTFFFADCCGNTPIQVGGFYIFHHFGFDELFQIPDKVLKTFLKNLENTYKPNPYHNSSHATDVMCSNLFLLCNSKLIQFSNSLDIMSSIVSALGHDAGHPAKNNRFLIQTKDEIAIRYNDISVLEMLHCSIVFKIMSQPDSNIFANLPAEKWNLARKLIIEMILATDMSKHFELLGQFRGKYKTPESFEASNGDMKLEIYRLIIKAADIGHAAKTIELHERWCKLVVEEFYTQGDLEKNLGLSVSMYCDRETTDISKSQAGFIRNIVLPLFTAINFVLGSKDIDAECIEQLKTNEEFWIKRRKNIRGRSLIVKQTEYINRLNNLEGSRPSTRKPSLPDKYLS